MFRRACKAALAVSFVQLLYRYHYVGALRQTVIVVAVFALTASFGHVWLTKVLRIDSPPNNFDARLLMALALTTVFVLFGDAPAFVGTLPGVIINGLQSSVLTGLFSSGLNRRNPGAWKPGFWKERQYLPAMLLIASVSILLVVGFWFVLRWWSFLIVPGILLGNGLGEWIGKSVRRWLIALEKVWGVVRQMGAPIGAFALGYVVIAFIFAGLFASVWRADPTAFKGLSEHPTFIDFVYYSVMTITLRLGLNDLSRKVEGLTPERLIADEAFVSAFAHATQAALKTHQAEKIEALRNAVLNVAIGSAPSEDLQLIFLNMIDSFTPKHMQVLRFLTDRNPDTFQVLRSQRDLIDQIINDLNSRGLLKDPRPYDARDRYFPDGLIVCIWELSSQGKQFLEFIKSPAGAT
jgi:hypothetical protein